MRSKARKIDKGSVLDFGGLGIADEALLARSPRRLDEAQLERPIALLDLDRINQDSPFQTRQEGFDLRAHPEDEELLESVQANGVLEPIMVLEMSSPVDTQSYQIVFGHRRVAAARLAGLDKITAIVAQDEDLSVRSLGQRTGIPYQTVSTLLRAYQESPPVLRGMFAQGLAPGAVLELVPLFEATPESKRQEMAKAMRGLTRRQAQGIRALVERGASPQAAIQAALGAEVSQRVSTIRSPESVPPPENADNLIRTDRKPPTTLPSANDGKTIKKISGYTGASSAKIKRLIEQANLAYVGKEILVLACAYAGNRGDERARFLNLKKRAKNQMMTLDDQRKVEFVNTVIFGK
jgi:hypothetical protein